MEKQSVEGGADDSNSDKAGKMEEDCQVSGPTQAGGQHNSLSLSARLTTAADQDRAATPVTKEHRASTTRPAQPARSGLAMVDKQGKKKKFRCQSQFSSTIPPLTGRPQRRPTPDGCEHWHRRGRSSRQGGPVVAGAVPAQRPRNPWPAGRANSGHEWASSKYCAMCVCVCFVQCHVGQVGLATSTHHLVPSHSVVCPSVSQATATRGAPFAAGQASKQEAGADDAG